MTKSGTAGRVFFTRFLPALLIASTLLTEVATAQDVPTPPVQPEQGPGGIARTYPEMQSTSHGKRPTGYWLFEPVDASGMPPAEPLPLVIFLHGFIVIDPFLYGEWIEHIVRGGAVVVFPYYYQTLNPLTLRPSEYLDNVHTAVEDALMRLTEPGHAVVDSAHTAVVGHSAGGVLAANYAATAEQHGLPVPSVIMPVQPGGCSGVGGGVSEALNLDLDDLSTIDPTTRVIVVAGDNDRLVGTGPARCIWEAMSSLQPGNRDYIIIQSDDHGKPSLTADHLLPVESLGGNVDALGWYGTWKLFDGLIACAFDGSNCTQALGGTPFQEFMGEWSDGTPVKPALIESA